MNKTIKIIVILFPVILIGAYFYGLTFGYPSAPSFLPTCPPNCEGVSEVVIIHCPVGFAEGILFAEPIGGGHSEQKACFLIDNDPFDLSTHVTLFCGDTYVDAQGMVLTATCSVIVP